MRKFYLFMLCLVLLCFSIEGISAEEDVLSELPDESPEYSDERGEADHFPEMDFEEQKLPSENITLITVEGACLPEPTSCPTKDAPVNSGTKDVFLPEPTQAKAMDDRTDLPVPEEVSIDPVVSPEAPESPDVQEILLDIRPVRSDDEDLNLLSESSDPHTVPDLTDPAADPGEPILAEVTEKEPPMPEHDSLLQEKTGNAASSDDIISAVHEETREANQLFRQTDRLADLLVSVTLNSDRNQNSEDEWTLLEDDLINLEFCFQETETLRFQEGKMSYMLPHGFITEEGRITDDTQMDEMTVSSLGEIQGVWKRNSSEPQTLCFTVTARWKGGNTEVDFGHHVRRRILTIEDARDDCIAEGEGSESNSSPASDGLYEEKTEESACTESQGGMQEQDITDMKQADPSPNDSLLCCSKPDLNESANSDACSDDSVILLELEQESEALEEPPDPFKPKQSQPCYQEITVDVPLECDSLASICVRGILPESASVSAESVSIQMSGEKVLCAFDIRIYSSDGVEYMPGADTVMVSISVPALDTGTDEHYLHVYHLSNDTHDQQRIPVQSSGSGQICFQMVTP